MHFLEKNAGVWIRYCESAPLDMDKHCSMIVG